MDLLESAPGAEQRRREERFALNFAVSVRERGRHRQVARLTTLSRGGCSVSDTILVSGEQTIWVRIPGLESQATTLRWTQAGTSGLAFDHPLHPAVFARFLSPQPSGAGPLNPHGPADASSAALSGSRKQQILSGWAEPAERILAKKQPLENGKAMSGLVRRQTKRAADHRRERRYPSPGDDTARLRVGSRTASLIDMSPSGLQADLDFAVTIGSTLPISFDGFDDLTGEVVWARGGQVGFALAPNAIELREWAET